MDTIEKKKLALELLDQLFILEKMQDQNYKKLLAEKHIYSNGDSAVYFHFKILKELVKEL